ncbi:hypothetical protein X801_05563 [Opisthorchis viverrini]|uniref:Dynein heavy chain tail domain-containing protein n=1 Tax=Opisthorchis viverrini TaxID=6198 RepID=A0A1S8WWI3_OPIVI|nr:hypothetical protein X801_05563 [Opisthorchis viverrini]
MSPNRSISSKGEYHKDNNTITSQQSPKNWMISLALSHCDLLQSEHHNGVINNKHYSTMSYETYRAFLHIVCKHLGMSDPTDAIDDFFSRDPNNKNLIADLLSETSLAGYESYAQCFGVGFYKVIVNDRRVFRIPVSFGTTVLRKPQNSVQTSKGSQKSHSNETNYTVLGVVDHGVTHRASAPTDTERVNTPKTLSVRESLVSSHGMTLTTVSCDTEAAPGYCQQVHYMVVSRMYPRECLFAIPLNLLCTSDELDENRAYFYAIRSNTGTSAPRIKYQNDPMQLFPVNISVGYLRGSLLECAHRLFSMVFMRLLAYFNQRKDLFTRPDGEASGKAAMIGKVSWAGGGGAQASPQQNAPGHMTKDESGQSTDDSNTHRSKAAHPGRSAVFSGGSTEESQRLRDEFSVTLFKFGSVLEETILALQGVFNLKEPDFQPDEDYVIDPSRDYLMLPHVTKLLKVWDQQIDSVMERLNPYRTTDCGPLDEVDYWRHRCKVLTAIAEALRSKKSQWVINAWAVLNPEAPPYNRGAEIKAQMLEAKDNASQSIRNILREVRAAIRMLTTFENTYLLERQRVEATSQDNRWEFDRKSLFGDIHYMKRILTDIYDMAKVVFNTHSFLYRQCANEFYHMFGPELKNITGDNKTLSEILRLVDQLFTAMKSQELPCPFLQKNEKAWLKVKTEFEDNASMIDAKAKNFINDYFAHIRGPTSAFDLLEKFKSVKARAAITCLLKDKYRDVLRSFGNEVKARYISLAEELRKYERARHRSWEAEVNATVSLRLSQPILFKHTNQIPYDQVWVVHDYSSYVFFEYCGCLPVYEVNFDSRLWSVVQEAARMELFGLALPEIGRFLGLRVSDPAVEALTNSG